MAMRDQRELALQCLDVETAGSSVIEFLKSRGFISPAATWQRLQLNELGRKTYNLTNGKDAKTMGDIRTRLKPEQKEQAIQKFYVGGNKAVYEYLKSCGISNEVKCWKNIQDRLKKIDPEEAKKLVMAKAERKVKKIETPEHNQIRRVEIPEKKKITVPLTYDGYTVCCIESKTFGRFYFDRDHNRLDWTTGEGEEVSYTPTGWKAFLEELPKVAAILGVDL